MKIDQKNYRAKKMMLWFAMISMSMTFAGLTSSYVVSSRRDDWINNFDLPIEFLVSAILILITSFTIHTAKRFMLKGDNFKQLIFLWSTIFTAIVFLIFQFIGFSKIIDMGYYFTGPESSITTSFIYVLVLIHMLHFIAGIITLIVVTYNSHFKVYNNQNKIGFELATIFWHFLDILWIYLYVFVVAIN